MDIIIKHYKANYCPNLRKILSYTDGCAAQFKNFKFLTNVMYSQEDFGVEFECHFSERYHSKSCCDGLGGTIKRYVQQRVMTDQYEVYNAKQFVDVARLFCDKIHVIDVTEEEINEKKDVLEQRWQNARTVTDTRKFHSFKKVSDTHVECAIASKGEGVCNRKLLK